MQEYLYGKDLNENNPHTFYELISDNKNSSSSINLPSKYDQWLAKQQPSDLMPTNLTILFSHNGDIFY